MHERPTTRRVARALLVPGLALVLLVGALVLLAWCSLGQGPRCASPPTQEDRLRQESFVRTHLPDAQDFAWTVMDCDDAGDAYVDFTTRQRGSVATRAFLDDPACRASDEPDASTGDVVCTSGGVEVEVHLEDHGAVTTDGELALQPG